MIKHCIFSDGFVVCGDSTDKQVQSFVASTLQTFQQTQKVPLIIADPPYGNVVKDKWDRTNLPDEKFSSWMVDWTNDWRNFLEEGAAFYVWGGVGSVSFRPFFKYLTKVESPGKFELANLVTWSKKRGYGVQNNYLFTREELAYFIEGNAKKPKIFNVPHLTSVRGYAGYNKKYPALSSNYRRTNVWTDINELFRGKIHTAQKAEGVIAIPIQVHTNVNDFVLDPFAGCGTTGVVARKLGRKFGLVELDETSYETIVQRLK